MINYIRDPEIVKKWSRVKKQTEDSSTNIAQFAEQKILKCVIDV